jgi:hypothetical protein
MFQCLRPAGFELVTDIHWCHVIRANRGDDDDDDDDEFLMC